MTLANRLLVYLALAVAIAFTGAVRPAIGATYFPIAESGTYRMLADATEGEYTPVDPDDPSTYLSTAQICAVRCAAQPCTSAELLQPESYLRCESPDSAGRVDFQFEIANTGAIVFVTAVARNISRVPSEPSDDFAVIVFVPPGKPIMRDPAQQTSRLWIREPRVEVLS